MLTASQPYYSCQWIEGGISLHYNSLKFCCQPHSGGKGMPHICDFNGGPLPIETIREARQSLIEANQTAADTPCKGCRFLTLETWEPPSHFLQTITVNNYTACNLRCEYCYTVVEKEWNLDAKGYELLPIFRDLVGQDLLSPKAKITLGGGEPTIYSEFDELIAFLSSHAASMQVFSNSVRFSPSLEKALENQFISLETSVDAGTPETYAALKGKNALQTVWENLARYTATGGEVCAKYIVKSNNSSPVEIDAFLSRCIDTKVSSIHVTPEFFELSKGEVTEETLRAAAQLIYGARRANIDVNKDAEAFGPYGHAIRMLSSQLFSLGGFVDDLMALWAEGKREEVLAIVFGNTSFVSFLDEEIYRHEKNIAYLGDKYEKNLAHFTDKFEENQAHYIDKFEKNQAHYIEKFEHTLKLHVTATDKRLSEFEKVSSYLGDRFEERMAILDGKVFKQEKDTVAFQSAFSDLYEKYERQIAEVMNRLNSMEQAINSLSDKQETTLTSSDLEPKLDYVHERIQNAQERMAAIEAEHLTELRDTLAGIQSMTNALDRKLDQIENSLLGRLLIRDNTE